MDKAKITAVCGMMSALSVVLMLVSTVLPVLMYVLPIVTSILVLFVIQFSDKKWAFGVYLSTAVLSMILLTDKETALTYTMFFGYYPLIKDTIQKLPLVISWLVKFAIFNAAAVGISLLGIWIFGVSAEEYNEFGKYTIPILLGLANVAFIFYDIAIMTNIRVLKALALKLRKNLRIR